MTTSQLIESRGSSYGRIILTLAAKDIVDAVRNKTILTLIVGLAFVMLSVEALPLLMRLDDTPWLILFDGDRTSLADQLRQSGAARVSAVRSAADALAAAQAASSSVVAVVLPAGWTEPAGGELVLTGYYPHWVGADADVAGMAATLAAALNRPVVIEATAVYPQPDGGGRSGMVSLGLVLIIMLITVTLVPHLLVEEKTTHTLELLRVSPANATQIALGKGIAGTVYGFLAAGILLLFNPGFVVQWGVLLLAVAAGTVMGVAIGLLLGIMAENESTVQIWVAVVAIAAVFPLVLELLAQNPLSGWLLTVYQYLPTVTLFHLLQLAFSNQSQPWSVVANLLPLLVTLLVCGGLTTRRLRHWEYA